MFSSTTVFDTVYNNVLKSSRRFLEALGIIHPELPRFVAYSVFGITTFLVDLGLLWICTDVFSMRVLPATAFSFLVAITLNYLSNRMWVFRGTNRKIGKGYLYFISIAVIGLILVLGLMWIMTHVLNIHFVTARIIAAALVGFWNFGMNRVFNF